MILDTASIPSGPIAIIELPFRLRAGIHGSWVMSKDLPGDKDLCDMSGVTEELKREFGNIGIPTEKVNGGPAQANGKT